MIESIAMIDDKFAKCLTIYGAAIKLSLLDIKKTLEVFSKIETPWKDTDKIFTLFEGMAAAKFPFVILLKENLEKNFEASLIPDPQQIGVSRGGEKISCALNGLYNFSYDRPSLKRNIINGILVVLGNNEGSDVIRNTIAIAKSGISNKISLGTPIESAVMDIKNGLIRRF